MVAKISVATNENWRDKNGEWQTKTEWHNIVGWRNAAEAIMRLQKGDRVYVEGKIETRKYETQDGQTKYITEIVAHTAKRLNARDNDQPRSESTTTNYSEPAKAAASPTAEDDDLPF